ncbi:MAG TPA: hypothetical protein VII28_10535 [Puia sp.]
MNFAAVDRIGYPTYRMTCFFGITGLRYALPYGLGISDRYMYGFSSILETDPLKEVSVHQQSFNFSLDYIFH